MICQSELVLETLGFPTFTLLGRHGVEPPVDFDLIGSGLVEEVIKGELVIIPLLRLRRGPALSPFVHRPSLPASSTPS
ncbi:MAG: hypothetical protein K2R93_00085 [Gemmatimonadaceae bacterium]|nr:hypothetical protein [Gemmatimonadaceae bacterium]